MWTKRTADSILKRGGLMSETNSRYMLANLKKNFNFQFYILPPSINRCPIVYLNLGVPMH
jgi:hypothetical protein